MTRTRKNPVETIDVRDAEGRWITSVQAQVTETGTASYDGPMAQIDGHWRPLKGAGLASGVRRYVQFPKKIPSYAKNPRRNPTRHGAATLDDLQGVHVGAHVEVTTHSRKRVSGVLVHKSKDLMGINGPKGAHYILVVNVASGGLHLIAGHRNHGPVKSVTVKRGNPLEPGDQPTQPYPFASKENDYRYRPDDYIASGLQEAVRSRDHADQIGRRHADEAAAARAAFKRAEAAKAQAENIADTSYRVYGWHADDVHTLAAERTRRADKAKGVLQGLGLRSNPKLPLGVRSQKELADLLRQARDLDSQADFAARELSPTHARVLNLREEANGLRRRVASQAKLKAHIKARGPTKKVKLPASRHNPAYTSVEAIKAAVVRSAVPVQVHGRVHHAKAEGGPHGSILVLPRAIGGGRPDYDSPYVIELRPSQPLNATQYERLERTLAPFAEVQSLMSRKPGVFPVRRNPKSARNPRRNPLTSWEKKAHEIIARESLAAAKKARSPRGKWMPYSTPDHVDALVTALGIPDDREREEMIKYLFHIIDTGAYTQIPGHLLEPQRKTRAFMEQSAAFHARSDTLAGRKRARRANPRGDIILASDTITLDRYPETPWTLSLKPVSKVHYTGDGGLEFMGPGSVRWIDDIDQPAAREASVRIARWIKPLTPAQMAEALDKLNVPYLGRYRGDSEALSTILTNALRDRLVPAVKVNPRYSRSNPKGEALYGYTQGFLQGHAEWGTPDPDPMERKQDPYAQGYRAGRHAAGMHRPATAETAKLYAEGRGGADGRADTRWALRSNPKGSR